MITAAVTLVVSFLAMVGMLWAKLHEIKAGRQILAIRARTWVENKVRQTGRTTRDVIQVGATKHFWTGLSSFVGRKFVEKVWHHPRVQGVTKKAADVVRGKKEINSTGPVSFYLKDDSDYKSKVRSK